MPPPSPHGWLRPSLVAMTGAGASWLVTLLVLGNNGLQYAVSGEFFRAFATPMAYLAAAGAAFLAALVAARVTGLSRQELPTVLAALLVLDLLLAVASTVLIGELEPPNIPIVFLVVSAWGLQFAGVALGSRLGGRTESDVLRR
jgi:hypothetical protein